MTEDAYPYPLASAIFQHWIFSVGIGKCQFTQTTEQRRLSALDQVWVSTNSLKCLLASQVLQQLMDKLFRDMPFVTTYINDNAHHSATEELHQQHLRAVFQRLKEAGLTLRGKKCHIRMSEVPYMVHVFSGAGVAPDLEKV